MLVLISLAGTPNRSGMTTALHSNTQLWQPRVAGTKLKTARSPTERSQCLIYVTMEQAACTNEFQFTSPLECFPP